MGLFSLKSYAQKDSITQPNDTLKSTGQSHKADSVKQIDFYDVLAYLFKIHTSSRIDTGYVKPGHLLFAFIPAIGYTLANGLEGSLSANISLYTADPYNTNLSVFFTTIQYSIHNQLEVPVMNRIWLKDNDYEILGDVRFFSYPSKTYGLGSSATLAVTDHINYFYTRFHESILRHFSSFYYLGGGYFFDYHWDVRDYTNLTDYVQYDGGRTHTISSGLAFMFKFDNRTNSNNPKSGFLGSVTYRYNSPLLGSDNEWQYIETEARKYFNLAKKHRLILGFWDLNRFAYGGYVPYLDLPSNGFGTEHYTARGYIQSRFRGNYMLYEEGELRFGITRNGLIGGAIFANATSISNWPTNNINAIFPGYGAGLRFKFNKYSDVNICADYAIGVGGSHGFFFNLGEVF